jgi:hypothetical protein
MKKLFTLLLVVIIVSGILKAQDMVFDFEDGTLQGWASTSSVQTNIDNPYPGGINSSPKVAKVEHTSGQQWYDHFSLTNYPSLDWSQYTAIEFDVYIENTVSTMGLGFYMKGSESGAENILNDWWGPEINTWVHYSIDITKLTAFDYTIVTFCNSASNICYIDNIKFVAKSTTPPTGIILSPGDTVLVGKTWLLTTTIVPADANPDVTYTSSVEDVATIDAIGNVTVVGAGVTTITATSYLSDAVTATTVVTGVAPDPANSIVLGNFENSDCFGWYDPERLVPEIIPNPAISAENPSTNVMKIGNQNQWVGFGLTGGNWNLFSKLVFYVYSDDGMADLGFQVTQFSPDFYREVYANVPPQTWTKVELVLDAHLDTTRELYFNLNSPGAESSINPTGYTYYLDNVLLIAGTDFTPVESFTIDGAGAVSSITADKGTLQMEAKDFLPAGATNKKVVWSVTSFPACAAISPEGQLTAEGNGTATVLAVADGGGVFAEKNITITGQTTGIKEAKATMNIGPNPVSDVLNIQGSEMIHSVAVYNITGKQICILNINAPSASIKFAEFKNGLYFVKVQTESGVKTQMIIKE